MRALLEDCILNDPRVNSQDEDRGGYYAQLLLARGISLRSIKRRLMKDDDRDFDTERSFLPLEVLAALSMRGDGGAIDILRRYVGIGFWWETALYALLRTGRPEAWKGLDRVIESRFPSVEELKKAHLLVSSFSEPPWNEWKKSHGSLGALLRRQQRGRSRRKPEPPPDFSSMTTLELLDIAEQRQGPRARDAFRTRLREELACRKSRSDQRVLLAGIDINRRHRAMPALIALAAQASPSVREPAIRVLETAPANEFFLIMTAADALASLPPHPLTRRAMLRWRSSSSEFRCSAAHWILCKHAIEEDLPWIRRQLARPVTYRRVDYILRLVDAVANRFAKHGPFPHLVRLYHAYNYSYGRGRILKALMVTGPDLAHDILIESLWDCEPSVRAIACQHVDLTAPGVTDRLRELAADPLEEEDVREAATARLK